MPLPCLWLLKLTSRLLQRRDVHKDGLIKMNRWWFCMLGNITITFLGCPITADKEGGSLRVFIPVKATSTSHLAPSGWRISPMCGPCSCRAEDYSYKGTCWVQAKVDHAKNFSKEQNSGREKFLQMLQRRFQTQLEIVQKDFNDRRRHRPHKQFHWKEKHF